MYGEALLLPIATLVIGIYYVWTCVTKNFDFWKRQKVPFVPPVPILGSYQWRSRNQPLHEEEIDRYNTYGRIYGRYEGNKPVLSVGDPNILKKIFVKDFQIFPNRRDMKFHDPIMDNTLFVLEGDAWKRVRNIVTPSFTTAKLKRMLPLLDECCDVLVENLTESAKSTEKVIRCQRFFEGFVLCAIGRCAFGMTIKSLKDPENLFVEKAKKLFNESFSWRTHLTILCPILMKFLRLSLLNPETTNFYRNTIIEVLAERKKRNLVKDDFLQNLLDAETSIKDTNNNGNNAPCEQDNCKVNIETKPAFKSLSHDEMLSQCITFFIAGFDPTVTLLSHVLYQLAMNPHYQDRAIEEITEALNAHNGKLCYESLSEMKFMDAVLNECMRLCPTMARHERRAEADYEFSEANIKLQKGMLVSIPVYAIHHDSEWYPEPETFRPERFVDPDPQRPQYVHLPFGSGPRICVGMRFVQMEVKLCLAKVLLKFQVLPAPTTPKTLKHLESRNIMRVDEVDVCLQERRWD